MLDIYRASNYTKSDILLIWYSPDPTVQEFLGTGKLFCCFLLDFYFSYAHNFSCPISDAELMRILFPTSTQQYKEFRTTPDQRCSLENNQTEQQYYGEPEGACDSETHSLKKAIVSNFRPSAEVGDAARSPAYDAIKSVKISDLQ